MRKMINRITSCFMCAALMITTLAPVPAYAAATAPSEFKVSVKKLSGDWLSGYYTVYEINGHEYRSDRMGTAYNRRAWDNMSDQDRKKLITNYAFCRKALEDQFGKEKTDEMMGWYEAASGWTEARKILESRIAKKEFPRLTEFYSDTCENRMNVALKPCGFKLEDYKYIPEVQEFLNIDPQMRLLYDTGKSAYDIILGAKKNQISTAIKTLSAITIKQLIVDRMLVPAISPGGLNALMPNLGGELWGMYDNIKGYSDDIYKDCGLGDWPKSSDARKIIDHYSKVIEGNSSYANVCVDTFMQLKYDKVRKYAAAVEAVNKLEEDSRKKEKELEEKIIEDADKLDPVDPQVSTKQELNAKLKELTDEYFAWNSALSDEKNKNRTKLGNIYSRFGTYANEEIDGDIVSCVNGANFNRLLNISYLKYKDAVPGAFDDAIAKVDEYAGQLSDYEKEYNERMSELTEEWNGFEARLKGIKAALEAAGDSTSYSLRTEYTAEDGTVYEKTALTNYYEACGRVYYYPKDENGHQSDEEVPLDFADIRKMMDDRKAELAGRKAQWADASKGYEDDLNHKIDEYEKWQQIHDEAVKEYKKGRSDRDEAAQEAAIYDSSTGNKLNSQELQREFDRLVSARDAASLKELCALWGKDLDTKLTAAQQGAARMSYGSSRNIDSMNAMSNITYNDNTIDFWNALSGKQLKYHNDLINESGSCEFNGNGKIVLAPYDTKTGAKESALRAYQEFADNNGMAYENDMYYASLLDRKAEYMRGLVTKTELLAPYNDPQSALNWVPGVVVREYGDYYNVYPHTSYLWRGLANMDAVNGRADAYELFDEDKKGSWSYELKHGYVPVERIYLDGDVEKAGGITMEPGEVKNLNKLVNVLPTNASDKALFWESSDEDVILIDRKGIATAGIDGTATLTVHARDSVETLNEDGTVTYTPGALTFTVKVGTGTAAGGYFNENSTWKNFGTEESPKLYTVERMANGHTAVRCAVSSLTLEEEHIEVALYDGNGRMLDSELVEYSQESGYRTVTLEADNPDGLKIKAFAIKTDGTFAPIDGVMLLDETVN